MREFKILAAGELMSGKTSFLNALMGEEIIPTGDKGWFPTTRTTVDVHYAETRRSIACFRNPCPAEYTAELTSDMQRQIDNYKYSEIPPISFDWKDLPEYVLSTKGESHVPIEHFFLSTPNHFLQEGISLIDTKSYIVADSNNHSLLNVLYTPDVLLFFLCAELLMFKDGTVDFCPDTKNFLISHIAKGNWPNLCFLISCFDQLNPEQADLAYRGIPALLNRYVPNHPYKLFYVRPDYAYASQVEGKQELLYLSGLPNVKAYLYEQLSKFKKTQQ